MNTNVHRAPQTMALINGLLELDQGSLFRHWLGKVLPHIGDAYREGEDSFRSHLGASIIGRECPREIWYSFHWATRPFFEGRMLRLFNRGHLEEGRFISLLLMAGFAVYQQDANGNQYRISHAGGHFGGSGDGVVVGLPELQPGQAALLEFKTHSEKSFTKLVSDGVREAKFEHFVQMQMYMRKMGLAVALYMAVNKNNDDIYEELVYLDPLLADQFLERGEKLVFATEPPARIGKSVGSYKCKFCDHIDVCHRKKEPSVNCRTCKHSKVHEDGTWRCLHPTQWGIGTEHVLPKEVQLSACPSYEASDFTV